MPVLSVLKNLYSSLGLFSCRYIALLLIYKDACPMIRCPVVNQRARRHNSIASESDVHRIEEVVRTMCCRQRNNASRRVQDSSNGTAFLNGDTNKPLSSSTTASDINVQANNNITVVITVQRPNVIYKPSYIVSDECCLGKSAHANYRCYSALVIGIIFTYMGVDLLDNYLSDVIVVNIQSILGFILVAILFPISCEKTILYQVFKTFDFWYLLFQLQAINILYMLYPSEPPEHDAEYITAIVNVIVGIGISTIEIASVDTIQDYNKGYRKAILWTLLVGSWLWERISAYFVQDLSTTDSVCMFYYHCSSASVICNNLRVCLFIYGTRTVFNIWRNPSHMTFVQARVQVSMIVGADAKSHLQFLR